MTARAPERSVPLARRQLGAERAKLVLAVIGVALSVALVGLLLGLRAGIAKQVTRYEDRSGAQVYVGGAGARDLMVTDSVVPASLAARIERLVRGAQAAPMTASLEMLTLHGRKTATLVIGFEPGHLGGPWQMRDGRPPARLGEITVDRVLARQHGIALGDRFAVRGEPLRVVGITDKTSAWMTPLLFTTRSEANALNDRGDVASYIVVRGPGSPSALAARLHARLPGLAVLTREQVAANDRELMTSAFNALLLVMVLVGLGVGAFVIGLSVYGFVAERRREFGMLKAIGGSSRRLYRLVSTQALAIAAAGVGVGFVLQRAAASAMTALDPKYLFVFKPAHVAVVLVAAIAMALAGAWAPARIVARLDPAEVFRR
jgi:putative ABC transport system permease protein